MSQMLSLYRKIFPNEEGFKRNFSVLTFCNFLIHFVNLLTNMFLARALGPEGFGQYGVFVTWTSILQTIASLGVDQVVVRATARDQGDSLFYFRLSSLVRSFGCALTFVLFAIYCKLTNGLDNIVFGLVLLSTVSLIIWSNIQCVTFGMQRMESTGYINAVGTSIFLLACFLIPSKGIDVFVVFILLIASQLSKDLYYYYDCKRNNIFRNDNNKKVSLKKVKSIIKESFPFFILLVFGLFTSQLPVLFLAKNANNVEVAYFSTANKLMVPFTMIISTLFSALYPKLVSDRSNNPIRFYALARKTLLIITVSSIAFCLSISLFRDGIVFLIYGEEYRNTGIVMLTQCWYVAYFGILSLFGCLYAVMGRDKLLAVLSIVNSLVWTPLIWLMSHDGAASMSYGFVIGSIINVITNSIAVYYLNRNIFSLFQLLSINIVLFMGLTISLFVPSEINIGFRLFLLSIIAIFAFLFMKRFVMKPCDNII